MAQARPLWSAGGEGKPIDGNDVCREQLSSGMAWYTGTTSTSWPRNIEPDTGTEEDVTSSQKTGHLEAGKNWRYFPDGGRSQMKKSKFTEERIAFTLHQADTGTSIEEVYRPHVVKRTRPVTADLALLFGKALGQSPQYWLNLQTTYDLKIAEHKIRARLEAVSELESA